MLALAALTLAIPLHFEPNRSQTGFAGVTRCYTLELSDTAIAMNFRGGSVRLKLPRTRPEGVDELPGKSSYYVGSDLSQWRTGIPNFARVRYRNVFRGVDLVVYGREQRIEYDWMVAPGADTRSIRFSFTGARKVWIDDGDLVLETAGGEVRHTRPRIYQSSGEIAGRFVLRGAEVGFEIGAYDRRKPLIIDPVLVVNTSFGGSGIGYTFPGLHGSVSDTGTGVATDSSGNIYVTGTTFSTNFPLVKSLEGAPSEPCGVNCVFSSVFVTKLRPGGNTLLYSTYIGAPPAPTQQILLPPLLAASIAADASGTVYVTGTTAGANFPGVTATAGGKDAFLLRLSPQGALMGTMLFGGSGDDAGTSIVLGPDGMIYLAGTTQSSNFPVTPGAYAAAPGSNNVFLTKISFLSIFGPTNGTVIYSSYLGPGTSAAVATDSGGSAYVAATTGSAAWPTTSGAVQPACAGTTCADIVIAKVDPSGQKLIYATYLGGSQTETLGGIAVDRAGNAYIAGATNSPDFPTTAGSFEPQPFPDAASRNPNYTGFVAKLSPDASKLVYATYLGGSVSDQAMAIAVDTGGNAYIGGTTTSPDFPLLDAIQSTPVNNICPGYTPSGTPAYEYDCASGGFLSVLNPSGTALVWSTYLGAGSVDALTLDAAGDIYATGVKIAINLPATDGGVGVVKVAPGASSLDVPASSIVNSASFAQGLPAPGGLASVTVRGLNLAGTIVGSGSPLPLELGGVTIFVDGAPAPMLAIAPVGSGMQQINFQVPFEAASNAVEIRYQGSSVLAFPQTAGPGIFLLGDGTPAIQHSADFSLMTTSNPAHAGEVIVVYATGLGKVSPAVASGVAASGAAAVAPTCGSYYSTLGSILYAGLTPGFVGLYQLNIQLPNDLPAGMVQLSIGGEICELPPAGVVQSNIVNLPVP